MTQQRIVFISHGGGPMPLLGDPGHQDMVDCLQSIASSLPTPSAILVISAHWEESIPTITSGETPSLIYDYYGFPEASYQIEYPCPGAPDLANDIAAALKESAIETKLDSQRGYDHGLFVPLKIMYPNANIPCIQLSLVSSLDPATHINVGHALQQLNHDNLLIMGSGFSFHNMRAFFSPSTSESISQNEDFEDWLIDTCTNRQMDKIERAEKLTQWEKAPGARFCHPREEHLLPLHVCYGAAQTACSKHYELSILGKKSSMYVW